MSTRYARLLPALILTASIACAVGGCRRQAAGADEEADSLPKEPVPARAAKAESTTLRPSVDLVGTLIALPETTTSISSQVAGWIQKVAVVEGATVRAGDEVVLLDNRAADVDVAKATASLAEKEAALARMKRGYLPQEIEVARQDVRQAQQSVESLRAELDAVAALRQKKEVSELQFQKLASSLKAAEAARSGAEAKLQLILAGTAAEDIGQAEARLGIAKAELAASQLNLKLCKITSPIAGTVTQMTARRGMFVERATPLATVVDLSQVFMQVRIPSVHLAHVKVGARVDVQVISLPDQVFPGAVARISAQADPATGNVDAFVAIPNRARLLRPGLACRGLLWLPEMNHVLTIPVAAVADRDGTSVVTLVRDNKAHETKVTLGVRVGDHVQVTEGLSPGDWVLTEGGYGLPDNCPVRIVDEPTTAPPADSAEKSP